MMETYITYFHKSLFNTEIKKLAFNLPHIRILGTNHCGNTCREAFKRCREKQDLLCHRDYADILLAIFSHQIQSE